MILTHGNKWQRYSANPFKSKHLPSRVQISTAEKASHSISPTWCQHVLCKYQLPRGVFEANAFGFHFVSLGFTPVGGKMGMLKITTGGKHRGQRTFFFKQTKRFTCYRGVLSSYLGNEQEGGLMTKPRINMQQCMSQKQPCPEITLAFENRMDRYHHDNVPMGQPEKCQTKHQAAQEHALKQGQSMRNNLLKPWVWVTEL